MKINTISIVTNSLLPKMILEFKKEIDEERIIFSVSYWEAQTIKREEMIISSLLKLIQGVFNDG